MRQVLVGIILLCLAGSAQAAASGDFKPAVLFETGALKSDSAFTEAAQRGVALAQKNLKVAVAEYKLPLNDDRKAAIRTMIDNGATHVIAVGFQNVVPVLQLAELYPAVKFTVIDGTVPPLYPNVQSVLFKDHEGAFLVGMIAAFHSRSGIIGFIGGMDVPLIRNFAYGYMQGAKHARPDIRLLTDMIGTTRDAWSNPVRAGALAQKQFEKGVDVIFAAAGGSGLGVLNAAHLSHKHAIGVDTNQNGLYPGTVLTSMVKRVDQAMFEVIKSAHEGTWEPGTKYLGLKEGALDFAVDSANRNLMTKDIIDKVETAKDLIMRGVLVVEPYTPN